MMSSKVFIIAEAGVNHNGDIKLAYKMIDVAKAAGADAIKFQTFVSENLVSTHAKKAEYQKENTGNQESQLEMLKKLELSYEDFRKLNEYCLKSGITFLSTAFDLESIGFLNTLNLPIWKVPSGEITNLPYLEKIAATKKEIIMSTGMSTLEEISDALGALKGAKKITILHCNTEYPTTMKDVNLRAMKTLKKEFGLDVGYSDHTEGIEVAIAAVALGANVIEKHFTLDKEMIGPDHKASLEPDELRRMVQSIRNVERALGSEKKGLTSSEEKNISIVRKSIVAKKRINKDEPFTEDNITIKRPGNGISPMKWYQVIGSVALKDFEEDEIITL